VEQESKIGLSLQWVLGDFMWFMWSFHVDFMWFFGGFTQ